VRQPAPNPLFGRGFGAGPTFPTERVTALAAKIGGMSKKPPRKPCRPRKSAAARQLLSAVDRMIAAARQAEGARRELSRQTEGRRHE